MKNIICPVSNEKIDEHITRANAFIGIALVVAGFSLNSFLFFIFLLTDFFIRAFTKAKFSPISYLSHLMVNALNLNKKKINKAPKIFAARVGFLLTLIVTVLFLLNDQTAALIAGGVFIFFATLEFALAICMGCVMYTYLILPFYK